MRRRAPRSPLEQLLVMAAALLALVGGYYWGNLHKAKYPQQSHPALHNLSAILLRDAAPLRNFELTTNRDKTFSPIDLKDHWSLLFFGCSQCADTAPTLQRLVQVRNRLADHPLLQETTRLILVTTDPAGDTPQRLDALVRDFGPGVIGLTGPPGQILDLSRQLGMPPPQEGTENPAILLISPAGKPVALFTARLDGAVIASDFKQIADADESQYR